MIETLLGLTMNATIADLGALAALTTIITEVLKKILPDSVPTRMVATITAIILSIIVCVLFYGVLIKGLLIGIVTGFVVAFVSMNGFDSLYQIWNRFNGNIELENKEDVEGEEGEG